VHGRGGEGSAYEDLWGEGESQRGGGGEEGVGSVLGHVFCVAGGDVVDDVGGELGAQG